MAHCVVHIYFGFNLSTFIFYLKIILLKYIYFNTFLHHHLILFLKIHFSENLTSLAKTFLVSSSNPLFKKFIFSENLTFLIKTILIL